MTEKDVTLTELKTHIGVKNNIQEVVDNHQRFFEQSETYQRKKNVIVTGLDETGSEDEDLTNVQAILDAMEIVTPIVPEKVMRLGKLPAPADVQAGDPADNPQGQRPRKRPILVSFKSSTDCKEVLSKTKSLKDNELYKTVYVKSDKPPHERREWNRLRQVCKAEKDRPANAGVPVRIDYRKRCVMVGDRIVDKGNFQHGPEL